MTLGLALERAIARLREPTGVNWPTIREGLRLADQFFDGDTSHWQWDDGEFFPADKVRAAWIAAQPPAEAQAPTLWCMHIHGPDDVHPAPSKDVAEQAAKAFNQRYAPIAERTGVMAKAVVTEWPHSPESHAEGVGTFLFDWVIPAGQDAEAQAQGGGDAVAWRILWSPDFPETHELTSDAARVGKILDLGNGPRIQPLYTAPPSAPVGVEQRAREAVALALDEAGHPAEANNVRKGIDLDEYRVELSSARIALAQQPAADRDIEADALQYVFGYMDRLDWARIVDEQMTPPRPLPHHVEAMGMFKQSAAVSLTGVELAQGPDDIPRLLLDGREVATFPAGSWAEVCEAFDFGGYRKEQPAAVRVEDWLIGDLMEAEEGGHTTHTPAELCGLAAKALKSLTAQQPAAVDGAMAGVLTDALSDMHGGDHHDDACFICRTIVALVAQPQGGA